MNRLGALGPAIRGFFSPIEKPTPPEQPQPNGHREGEGEPADSVQLKDR
jgi:ubiquinol-cytochrome c reductase cytochrome b subunit